MIISSVLGQIFQPIFVIFADLIALFYAIVPNYAVAISLLTIVVMIVTAPLTIKGTTSMMAMQRVAPEMKKIQQKYKGDRVKQNEELMALYKVHGVNPVSGCLPLLLQMPVFFILYGVIDGLINVIPGKHLKAAPRYIGHSTLIYHNLILSPGKMMSFGMNLANKALGHHVSIVGSLPFWGIVVAAIIAQYFQMSQMNRWNPDAAKANSQAQMMQKYMPIIMAIIYINIPAGVNIYFVVSSVCRIGIQEGIFRWGKKPGPVTEGSGTGGSQDKAGTVMASLGDSGGVGRRPGIMERIFAAQKRAIENAKELEAKKQSMIDEAKQGSGSGNNGQPVGRVAELDGKGGAGNGSTSNSKMRDGAGSSSDGSSGRGSISGGTEKNGTKATRDRRDFNGAKKTVSKGNDTRNESRSRNKRQRRPR
ncbi:MAG: YidC/Oxa1 family membrane protein insertase [Actinobacteria bacterium]|nr:YidC/Oxa1 family membrane protein insertase [Actinomycetota bacterium]MCL5445941.1 YidC/Oxa1 family membrane protein insertase [Actinomycetota bacterium]